MLSLLLSLSPLTLFMHTYPYPPPPHTHTLVRVIGLRTKTELLWALRHIIFMLGRLRQECSMVKVTLGFIVSPSLAQETQ